MKNLLSIFNVLITSLIMIDFFVDADPFTYQNDPRVLQIQIVNMLQGASINACSTASSPQSFTVPISFSPNFAVVPQVVLGVVQIKGTNQNLLGFSVTATAVSTSGFQIVVNCQQNLASNKLVTLNVQYLATIMQNVEILSKQYLSTALTSLTTGSNYRYINDQITFTMTKKQIPVVYPFVTGFIMQSGADKRFIIKAEISKIGLTQFTHTLSTNLLCSLSYAQVSFLTFWGIETSNNLLAAQPNNDDRPNPLQFNFWNFYTDQLNTNQTAISIFYGISQLDLANFNPTTPLTGPDVPVEVSVQQPNFQGNEYLFQIGSTSGTRNYETFVPWVIFLLKRCPANEYLQQNYLCSTLCPFNTFQQVVNYQGVCTNCDISCSSCNGPNPNQCTSCPFPSRVISNGMCLCAQGYYQGGTPQQLCQQCSYKCETCLNSADNCQSCTANRVLATNCGCPSGYWDQGVFEICPSCYRTCAQCINGDQNQCTACKVGYQLINGACICPDGFYDDMTKNQCSQCHYSCSTCNGGTDQDCLSCNSKLNRQLVQGKQCLCSVGYNEQNKVCVQNAKLTCVAYCETCLNSTTCSICQSGRLLVSNACICPKGYYSNLQTSLCAQCDQTCKTCTGPSQYECTFCNNDRTLENGMCNTKPSTNDSSVNIPLLVVVVLLVVCVIIFIPFLMRWTYYLSQKIWLRKRALSEFVEIKAREREERLKRGEGDIIIHDPIIITDPSEDFLNGNLDQSIIKESILLRDHQLQSKLKLPPPDKNNNLYNQNPLSPTNPHLQILSPKQQQF
ncbi:hypothetical protein ABPG74_021238 [Tetrahymena malaccensis]